MCRSTTQTVISLGGREFIIRRYQDIDKEQVHAMFRSGMESLVPTLTRKLVSDPLFFLPVGSAAWLMKLGISKVTTLLFAPSSSTSRGSSSRSSLGAWIASAGFVTASLLVAYGISDRMFSGYIQKSIATDLSDIAGTYFVKGGTFLVAEDASSGDIVGCIGGHCRIDKPTKKTFELRRMSVDTRVQRRGLGTKLVQCLEQELLKCGCRHICLGTMSLQTAAIELYKKSGFTLTETTHLQGKTDPLLVRRAVQFYRFDKHYAA